ncbi:MAG: transposase [Conexivisphaerales archaeon]
MISETDGPSEFRCKESIAKYLGLTPLRYETEGAARGSHMTKRGPFLFTVDKLVRILHYVKHYNILEIVFTMKAICITLYNDYRFKIECSI